MSDKIETLRSRWRKHQSGDICLSPDEIEEMVVELILHRE